MPKLLIALPVCEEPDLVRTLDDLWNQSRQPDRMMVCVNQCESDWQENPERCRQNQTTLEALKGFPRVEVLDRSSRLRGWTGDFRGVGAARKLLMDQLAENAAPNDILICVDADTRYPREYLAAVEAALEASPEALGLSVPYYHPLCGHPAEDRAMLRYEIYLRCFEWNLHRTHSVYAFTPLGSALAARCWAYRRVDGMQARLSGEDFYFLQKLAKNGALRIRCETQAYPAARFSNRVVFGTGPAMIRGDNGDWSAYPIYDPQGFNDWAEIETQIQQWWNGSPNHERAQNLSLDRWISPDLLRNWKANAKTYKAFQRFVWQKCDRLRLLQYLRVHPSNEIPEIERLRRNVETMGLRMPSLTRETLSDCGVDELAELREQLFRHAQDFLRLNGPCVGLV